MTIPALTWAAGLAWSLAPLLGGCGESGPDLAAPNEIVIDDPAGQLAAFHQAIRSLTDETLARVEASIGVRGVTIHIIPDAAHAIAGYGLGGYTPDAATVQLYVNPVYPALSGVLASRLPPLLAHELHHAMRHRNPGYGSTLFEAMVSEGMADHYAGELLRVAPPPWSVALTAAERTHWIAAARPQFDRRPYDHAAWFYGSDTIPLWTGYSLGYQFVADYLAAHPGVTVTSLLTVPAPAFRP